MNLQVAIDHLNTSISNLAKYDNRSAITLTIVVNALKYAMTTESQQPEKPDYDKAILDAAMEWYKQYTAVPSNPEQSCDARLALFGAIQSKIKAEKQTSSQTKSAIINKAFDEATKAFSEMFHAGRGTLGAGTPVVVISNDELRQLRQSNKNLQESLVNMHKKHFAATREINALTNRLTEKDRAIKVLTDRLTSLSRDTEQFKDGLSLANQKYFDANAKLENLKREIIRQLESTKPE